MRRVPEKSKRRDPGRNERDWYGIKYEAAENIARKCGVRCSVESKKRKMQKREGKVWKVK